MAIDLVQGWTERIIYALKSDGAVQPLSGITVDIELFDANSNPVAALGTVGTLSASDGTVFYDPADGELVHRLSPYQVRFKLTNTGGKQAFYPNAALEQWRVRLP